MPYRAPVSEYEFYLNNVLNFASLAETEKFAEATPETVTAILTEAAKLSDEVMAPLNRNGDLQGAYLENGVVRTSPGFADAYKMIAEGGWVGLTADPEYGGMGLPNTLGTCVGEMMGGANLALSLCPLLSVGQIDAMEHHASNDLKDLYLPKLISGEWTGTMNLTEPQAGSDVGAVRSKAEPNGDGTYRVSGQKIFISWGDHDVAENIVHMVLARLPDAAPGTKGLSLFLVPKFIPDADGNPGKRNAVNVVSLEHKMGLHGSPTAVMDYADATGWLVGGEHNGIKAMFTMMNAARLGVGVEGVSQAEAATQKAVEYARDRKQGRTPIEGGEGAIIDFADVRRNLMTMKSMTAAARAICLDCAISLDLARALDGQGAKDMAARGGVLTPIAKAFGTDAGCEVASLGIQVHGGMGYIEETGAAQYYRDVRVTAIYEGTNGIQAMDLVGRKLMDGGAAVGALLEEVAETVAAARATHPELSDRLAGALATLQDATDWMLAAEANDRNAGASPYLRAFALVLGGHYLLKAALADAARASLAAFFIRQILPQSEAACQASVEGATPLYALTGDELAGLV